MLRINVLRNSSFGDCSNNGVSARYNSLQMITESEMFGFTGDKKNVVVKIDRILWGKVMPVLVPLEVYNEYKTSKLPIMFGGNFGYTSDSRFGFDYPLPIHDRVETLDEYEALSLQEVENELFCL